MTDFIYQRDGRHDHSATQDELDDLLLDNLHNAWSNQQDDVHVLRADILQKLVRHGALGKVFGWVIFDLTRSESGSVAVADQPVSDEVLLITYPEEEGSRDRYTKLLHQQIFNCDDSNTAVITEEALIDHEGDCYHGLRGTVIGEDGDTGSSYPWFHTDGPDLLLGRTVFATLPTTYALKANDHSDLVPLIGELDLDDFTNAQDVVVPGLFFNSADAAYSLAKAMNIFEMVRHEEPVRCHRPG